MPDDPGWAARARVAPVRLVPSMAWEEVEAALASLKSDHASTALLTGPFERGLDQAAFLRTLDFIAKVTCLGHGMGLRVAMRFPSLRIESPAPYDPDLVQKGINGRLNVVRDDHDVVVSAWMCPNGPYREVLFDRAARIAGVGVDALYVTDLMFRGAGAAWPCTCSHCARAFHDWSVRMGLGGAEGLSVPAEADFHDPAFKAWVRWRHRTLADFARDLETAVRASHPETWIFIQDANVDHMEATENGLDATFIRPSGNLSHAWDIDGVSSVSGMKWATPEDFTSRLAMLKWGRSADGLNPSWAVSNGVGILDAGLSMGALLAEGLSPIEARSGPLPSRAAPGLRKAWFLVGAARPDLFPGGLRTADVGLWYSSATRDYVDYANAGGRAGSYVSASPPVDDAGWWSDDPADSCALMPHLGEYRGAAHALIRLGIPYRPLLSGFALPPETGELDAVWLPGVQALSDREIDELSRFVSNGGFLFATGDFPGSMDRFGRKRERNPLRSVFGVSNDEAPLDHIMPYGRGLAVYREEDLGADTIESFSGAEEANTALTEIERWFSIHSSRDRLLKGPSWVLVEDSVLSDRKRVIYAVNFNGLAQPLRKEPIDIEILYRIPEGFRVSDVTGPIWDRSNHPARFSRVAERIWSIKARLGVFGVFEVLLEPVETRKKPENWGPPLFADFIRKTTAVQGLNFVLNRFRNPSLPAPLRFGVRSRFLGDQIVTSRVMGLLLRTTACMDAPREWEDAFRYVDEVMSSRAYHIPGDAFYAATGRPVIEQDVLGGTWRQSDRPADDFRVVRGLIAGRTHFDRPGAGTLAATFLKGIYLTDTIKRNEMGSLAFPGYPGGLIGAAWEWEGVDDRMTDPIARATGHGETDRDIIPLENQDLQAMGFGASMDPRWRDELESAVDFLLDGEAANAGPPIGLFWNGMDGFTWTRTGDYERQDSIHGKHLNMVQVIRTALHLARASRLDAAVLDDTRRARARRAAQRTLRFLSIFHEAEGRIPEYLTISAEDVPDCLNDLLPDCLYHGIDNRYNGDVRIYSLAARLALELGNPDFARSLIERHILFDRVDDPDDPFYGQIGSSTEPPGDADATNVLESVLTLCMEARAGGGNHRPR